MKKKKLSEIDLSEIKEESSIEETRKEILNERITEDLTTKEEIRPVNSTPEHDFRKPYTSQKEVVEKIDTSFLRNETITVRYIKREDDYIKDPKHVGYGGLFESSVIAIPPPILDNKKMKNILTNKEKKGLEYLLDKDLSIYGNFWKESFRPGAMFPIFLGKDDVQLDLSDPIQYIVYKVLKVSPIVANSMDEIRHKATYRFVLISEGEELEKEKDIVDNKVKAYETYVKFKNNIPVLRYILRNLGRYTSRNQKLSFLQVEVPKEIEKDPALFVRVSTDPLMEMKVLIDEAVEAGVLIVRDKKYYTVEGEPVSAGDVPSLSVAAKYLSTPLGQEMRFAVEAKIKRARE